MTSSLPNGRPREECRTFVSPLLEARLAELNTDIKDSKMRTILTNCWSNTLDTTIFSHDGDLVIADHRFARPQTWIITGDIPAMWLRDSANQISAYLSLLQGPSSADWTALYRLVLGVVYTQAACINYYPFANAYLPPTSPIEASNTDHVLPHVPSAKRNEHGQRVGIEVWEAKWELDSLASFVDLSGKVLDVRDDLAYNSDWLDAVELVLEVCRAQQRGTDEEAVLIAKERAGSSSPSSNVYIGHGTVVSRVYRFNRKTSTASETRSLGGLGEPVRRCGLIKSSFRPSDDSTVLSFLTPSNAYFSVACKRLSKRLRKVLHACDHAEKGASQQILRLSELQIALETLSAQVEHAVWRHGVVIGPSGQPVFAYEVDGFGSYVLADDANLPSLLSLPYLGFVDGRDPVYQATRHLVLSDSNKWYFSGTDGCGIGGMHIGTGYVWPMSIITRALTSEADNDEEVLDCLKILNNTTAGTGFMHESFNVNDSDDFTRSWFAWANGLYGQLILQLLDDRPHLLK